MVAIGTTDLLFALDSIPAIFGLTQEPYLVFTANAFALMGLRQLFFLIDGLLDRLIFLSYGLAVILGFIGVKLILHALHENTLPFINDGEHVNVVEVSTGVSLSVILGVLVLTVLASIFSPKGKAKNAVSGARRHAVEYLDLNYETDMNERDKIFSAMCREEKQIRKLPEKYKRLIRNETEFMDLLRKAHNEHDKAQVRADAES
jgi:tellurite resistance protein TerC